MEPGGSSILPWQFPSLDEKAAEAPTAPVPPAAAAAPLPPDRPEEIASPAAAAAAAAAAIDTTAVAATDVAARIEEEGAKGYAAGQARGYAEGLEQGLREGRAQGAAAGNAEGRLAAEQDLADKARRLAALVEQLAAPIPVLESKVAEAVAALALELARCVIGSEVSRSRDYLVRLIREAVAKVPIEMGKPRLVLNPADLELVRALAPEIEEKGAAFFADETVEAGGCLLVADADSGAIADRRWHPRAGEGAAQVDLTLSARWRHAMLALFEGADD
jgi:flagellar assembly protein FliH